MSSLHRRLSQLLRGRRWRIRAEVSSLSSCRTFCSTTSAPDEAIEVHKKKLYQWFNHLPQEEKQFGGFFSPQTMHVDPLILESKPEERAGGLISPLHTPTSRPSLTVQQLFEHSDGCCDNRGLNVLLYGAVGTGKSTVVRKLVLDWCTGTTLTHFKLLIPFSCEDLGQLSKSSSVRDLVGRKYLHLRRHPMLSGERDLAKDVLFLFNGLEKMKLDFRIGATELCSDPNEALPPGVVVVNLLRKYLLPEASVLVTTRLSTLDRIPQKYVSRYAQICGFKDPDLQRAYFNSRLLQSGGSARVLETQSLLELLFLNLQRESALATACFLPSYCWLTCATLHFLRFTDANAPIRTLTGIFTSFLRLNFGGEVLAAGTNEEHQSSLMLYVVRTVGKLAYDGVENKRTTFSKTELEQWIGGKTKTDEELRQLATFQTDVLAFFLTPCVESGERTGESLEEQYSFAVPAMQEYMAALYVVLGENKSVFEKLSKQFSEALGQESEDFGAFVNIISKFIPLRIFAVFNLLKLFPKLYEKISRRNKASIARKIANEMFRNEDSDNDDALDQLEHSLLGYYGPQSRHYSEGQPFELYPIFMGGLLHYSNRNLLQQLGCSIHSSTAAQIIQAQRNYLVRGLSKPQSPDELMDFLILLYEYQNPRLTAEVFASIRSLNLTDIHMTSRKCYMLSSVLSCTPASYSLESLNLSSCLLTHDMLQMLRPAFRHIRSLNLQFNSLGPESCILLRDLLLEPKSAIRSLQLCGNPLLESGACTLLEALPENQTLTHLSLMHTGLGDRAALDLAERLQQHTGLQELDVAYNNIGDEAALTLVDACRNHPSIHTVHLYLNPLSDVGKRALYARGAPESHEGRRVRVLASVTEGSNISENWHPILSVIRENASSWDRQRVQQQLRAFLEDLEWGRQQQRSPWTRLHFRRVDYGVRKTLRMMEKETLSTATGPKE